MQVTPSAAPIVGARPTAIGRPERIEERLIVALDVPTVAEARQVVEMLDGVVGFFKIGLQLQFAHGGLAYAEELVADGKRVFLDSKFHDIAETVRRAVESVVAMGVHFLTVHGSTETIRAAAEARADSGLKIFSVTVLTNLDTDDLREMGYTVPVADLVRYRAEQAMAAGVDGVIASGQEAGNIREMAGDRLLIVTPGIRSQGEPRHDQRRVVTPTVAVEAGADYLVVGRPILKPERGLPKDAAIRILEEMDKARR